MAIRTPLNTRKTLYSDFHMDLFQNPVSLDLARNTNEEAVKQSIRNLLLTDRGERPFQPNLGSNLRSLLFENLMPDTILVAKEMVKETIENYEPRASLLGVDIIARDDHTISVVIVFNVINSEDDITLVTTLTRVR